MRPKLWSDTHRKHTHSLENSYGRQFHRVRPPSPVLTRRDRFSTLETTGKASVGIHSADPYAPGWRVAVANLVIISKGEERSQVWNVFRRREAAALAESDEGAWPQEGR